MPRLIVYYVSFLVLLSISPLAQQELLPMIPCPDGFVKIYDRCYYFSVEAETFDSSEFKCRERKSHLAAMSNKRQSFELKEYLRKLYVARVPRWLGGQYNWKKKKWIWRSTGKLVKYQSFAKGHSNDSSDWKCILSDPKSNYNWIAGHCFEKHFYTCQTRLSPINSTSSSNTNSSNSSIPSTQPGYYVVTTGSPILKPDDKLKCPKDFKLFRKKCYFFSSEKDTWQSAFHKCEERRAQLAILKFPGQDRKLKVYARRLKMNKSFWIGGMFNWKNRTWKWAKNGKLINATVDQNVENWSCLLWDPRIANKWLVGGCVSQQHYLCQANAKGNKKNPPGKWKADFQMQFKLYETTKSPEIKH